MLNPVAPNYSWNYSKPDKPGYSLMLVGTVVGIQEVQKLGYTMDGRPGAPQFWPDGNPVMNHRLILVTITGEYKTFTYQPAGKAAKQGLKPSVHMDLFHLTGDTDMKNLIGKTIIITTQEGHFGQGNPRPWTVALAEEGPYTATDPMPDEFKVPYLLADAAVSGGQVVAPQQPAQPKQMPYQQQPVQAQQMPYQQQPVQSQYVQAPAVPQMNPQVAAAMQHMGATNVQEVQGQVYNDPYPEEDTPY